MGKNPSPLLHSSSKGDGFLDINENRFTKWPRIQQIFLEFLEAVVARIFVKFAKSIEIRQGRQFKDWRSSHSQRFYNLPCHLQNG